MARFTIDGLEPEVADRLSRLAAEQGISRSELIRQILRSAVETPEEYDRINREEKMFSYVVEIMTDTIRSNQHIQKVLDEKFPK